MQGTINNWQTNAASRNFAAEDWVWNDTYSGQTYSLDAMGNFNKFYNNGTRRADPQSRATRSPAARRDGEEPDYDAAGNMTDDGEQYKLVYDFRNRLMEVTRQDDTPCRRRSLTTGSIAASARSPTPPTARRRFAMCGSFTTAQRIIEKRDNDNAHRPGDEPLRLRHAVRRRAGPHVPRLKLERRLRRPERELLLPPGPAVQRGGPDRYGRCGAGADGLRAYGKSTCHRISDGDETVASHFGNPYLFTGRDSTRKPASTTTATVTTATALSRFINTDPIGYRGGINLYEYVRDNPLNATDPSGRRTVKCTFMKMELNPAGDALEAKFWDQNVEASDTETASEACARVATGCGLADALECRFFQGTFGPQQGWHVSRRQTATGRRMGRRPSRGVDLYWQEAHPLRIGSVRNCVPVGYEGDRQQVQQRRGQVPAMSMSTLPTGGGSTLALRLLNNARNVSSVQAALRREKT